MVKNVVQHQPGETWWQKEKKITNTTPTSNTAFIDLTWMYLLRSQPVFLSHHSYLYLHLWTSSELEEVTHLARRLKTKRIASIAAPNLLCRTNTVQILHKYKVQANYKYKPSWMQQYCQRKEARQDLVVLWSLIATRDTTGVCLQGGESHWYGALISSLCFVFVLDWSFVFVSVSHVTLIHLCCIALSCIWVVLPSSVQWYICTWACQRNTVSDTLGGLEG